MAVKRLLGVRAAMGGKHLGLGTHNALLSLGDGAYLEIIAPDPEQPKPAQSRAFGLDDLREPRLVAWAMKAPDIEEQAARAVGAGFDLGPVIKMSRERPDGSRLHWSLTYRQGLVGDGLAPFLINWEPGPHPSETSPAGCQLVSMRAEHPEPERIGAMLEAIGVEMAVARGERPALVATVEGRGTVELR